MNIGGNATRRWAGRVAVLALGAGLAGCAKKAPPAPQATLEDRTPPVVTVDASRPAPEVSPPASQPAPAGESSAARFTTDARGRIVRRQWPLTASRVPSNDVPVGWVYARTLAGDPADLPMWQQPFVETGGFLFDAIALPVRLAMNPPWGEGTIWRGDRSAFALQPIDPKTGGVIEDPSRSLHPGK